MILTNMGEVNELVKHMELIQYDLNAFLIIWIFSWMYLLLIEP